MARPRRCRRVCAEPDYGSFRPDGIPGGVSITLTVDEYEVIRLIDLEKLTHEQCAKRMDISRTTVTEIYESAREKIADSIVNGKVLLISGGDYRLCDGSAIHFCQKRCGRPEGLNTQLFMNAVTANFEGVQNLSIEAKSLGTEYNTIQHTGVLSLLVIFGIPAVILIGGFVVWFRRRRA